MALPSEYFNTDNNTSAEDIVLDPSIDITKEINIGNLDLDEFLNKKGSETLPGLTLSPAPDIQVTEQVPQNNNPQQTPAPSADEVKKLEEIERLLMGLDEKINSIKLEESPLTTEPKKQTAAELLDLKLNEPIENAAEPIDVSMPQKVNNFNIDNTAVDERQHNEEKLNQFIEQKNIYLKQRDEILKNYSNVFNNNNLTNSINNENNENTISSILQNELNSQEINKNITNENNVSELNSFNKADQNIQQNLTQEFSTDQQFLTPVNKNTTENINNINNVLPNNNPIENNITNTSIDNIENLEKNIINKPPVFLKDGGIVTEPTSAVIGEAGPEAVIPLDETNLQETISSSIESGEGKLPSTGNEFSGHATEITAILKRVESAINNLGEKLGSNFSGLNESIKGIKSSSTANNFQANNSAGSSSNQPAQTEKGSRPDYSGEYPYPGDFPQGFDVTKLGGVNLPNPQSIA